MMQNMDFIHFYERSKEKRKAASIKQAHRQQQITRIKLL